MTPHKPPVLNIKEAAKYLGRTPNALKILRHRRRGPRSFIAAGRIKYYVRDLDDWLAKNAAADSRFNRDLDPMQSAPEPRRTRSAA